MTVWITAIIILYGVTFICMSGRYAVSLLNTVYDHGIENGKKLELERVLNLITREVWTFRRENYGMSVYCKLVSSVGEIPMPGPMDYRDGDQVLIQKRLPHHPHCPFFFLGFEAYLSVRVYRELPREDPDDDT